MPSTEKLLIAPKGIEIYTIEIRSIAKKLLIAPKGIEINDNQHHQVNTLTFNRTKRN